MKRLLLETDGSLAGFLILDGNDIVPAVRWDEPDPTLILAKVRKKVGLIERLLNWFDGISTQNTEMEQ